MKRPRLILSTIIGLVSMCASTLAFTIAWYTRNYQNMRNEIDGSVLESYFDSWDSGTSGNPGSKTNPFVITTPQHYENLVKLFTQKIYVSGQGYVDFSDGDYYFEIGKKFGTSTEYQVYDVDKYGVVGSTKTNVLNLEMLSSLEPIGNDTHPFKQHLEGHNIIVQNFTVTATSHSSGETYNDVGIFGYVASTARVTNTYWTKFVVDTSGAAAGPHQKSTETESKAKAHDDNVRVGYLAGHIKTYESFTNCYVNSCRVKSPKITSTQRIDYSYYGMCELDQSGGGTEGRSYEYSFDSQIWHDYFSTNYSTISSKDLCVRNHTIGEGADVKVAGSTFGSVVTRGGLGQYTINGHAVSSDYDGKDFSLSTTGYISGEREIQYDTFATKYYNGNNYLDVDASSHLTSTSPSAQAENGYYYYRTGTQWNYYHTANTITTGGSNEVVYPTFYIEGSDEYMYVAFKNCTITYYIYLDDSDQVYDSWSDTGRCHSLSCEWPSSTYTMQKPVPLGTHKISVLIYKHGYLKVSGKEWKAYYAMVGTKSDNTLTKTDLSTDYRCRYNSVTEQWDYLCPSIDRKLSNYQKNTPDWESHPTIGKTGAYTPLAKGTKIIGADNFEYPLYYIDNASQEPVQLIDSTDVSYENAVFNMVEGNLKVTVAKIGFKPGTEKHNFVGDEKEVAVDPEKSKRYKADSIDIVGGGVDFYYYYLPISQRSLKICRVQSESTKDEEKTIVKSVAGDIGEKFYATKYTRQSFVLYIDNVGSANDQVDDNLGEMDFKYYQLTNWFQNTCHPCFKKGTPEGSPGQNNFVDFTTLFGNPTPDSSGVLESYTAVKLTEAKIQKASYCCLDVNGYIIGTFDRDGKTTMTEAQKAKIATYVVAIGSYTNANEADWHLWIQETRFQYVAKSGEGGNFGSVEFRSRPDTVLSTYFNFNILAIPGNTVFYIDVKFTNTSTSEKISGSYEVTIASSTSFAMIFYNYYYNANYTLKVNGTPLTERINQYTVPATTSLTYENIPKPSWVT